MKRSPRLERYRRFVGNELLNQIYNAAASLAGLHILHINTTAQGGGVAELLHALMPVMDELGIKHTRKVVPLDDSSSRFEAHLVDLLQGIKHGDVAEEDQLVLLDTLRRTPVLRDEKKIKLISISSMISSLFLWRHYFHG